MHYLKFGFFISPSAINDFLHAPAVFQGYVSSGLSEEDWCLFVFGLVYCALAIFLVTKKLACAANGQKSPLLSLSLGLLFPNALFLLLCTYNLNYLRKLSEQAHPLTHLHIQLFNSFVPAPNLQKALSFAPATNQHQVVAPSDTAEHVILIIAESLRADHFPHYGYRRMTTPWLWENREAWSHIEYYFAHSPSTTPSFKTIFSSQYLATDRSIKYETAKIWQLLQASGYTSNLFSSGALEWGNLESILSFDRMDKAFTASQLSRENPALYEQNRLTFKNGVSDELTFGKLEKALRLSSEKGRRSVNFFHFLSTHYPFEVEEEFNVFRNSNTESSPKNEIPLKFKRHRGQKRVSHAFREESINSYDGAILYLDDMIRRLVATLTELGILEKSVIFLTGDHGEAFGEHNTFFHSTTLFNEQVRVPLLMRVGSELSHFEDSLKRKGNSPAGHIDIMPTLFHLTGNKSLKTFQGSSIFWDSKPYELLIMDSARPNVAIVKDGKKYLHDLSTDQFMIFDLERDPEEKLNLN